MKGKTRKSVEVEKFVDDYIVKHGHSPTYKIIKDHFGFKSDCTAYHRCRTFRDKMRSAVEMSHKYFVSYAYNSRQQTGFGSIELKLQKPVRSYKDAKLMDDFLTKNVKDAHGNAAKCVVINYIKLKE